MIKVSGKRGRHVPILLTEDVVSAMNLLLKERSYVNIKSSNTYFFANKGDKYLRAYEVLHSFVIQAGVSNPSAITSTNLRKYIATVSQVISLQKEELEWIADHLGHSIDVHRNFYRLQESTLEICKVSKLLMAVDSGSLHKLVGKKLTDIELEHCFPNENDSMNLKCLPNNANFEGNGSDQVHNEASVYSDVSECDQYSLCKRRKIFDKESEKSVQQEVEVNVIHEPRLLMGSARKRWDSTVKEQALKYFNTSLISRKVPGKLECNNFLKAYQVSERTWKDVKNLIYNEIRKL